MEGSDTPDTGGDTRRRHLARRRSGSADARPASAPEDYRRWLQPAVVDEWRTTYYQELTGPDAVWGWLTGSVLRPVLAALDADDGYRFAAECKQRYAVAYPHDADGNVLLPFSRLFLVATG